MNSLTITNSKILKYFNTHKEVDPENAFLLFIEILEKFGENIFESMSSSINKQILEGITENINHIKTLNDNINKINTDITNNIFLKMIDMKKDYIDDIKSIVSTNTNEKIAPLIERNNSQLMDKTNILLNDVIPKNNTTLTQTINEKMVSFQQLLKEQTEKIKKTNDETAIKEYFDTFERNFSGLLSNFQTNLQQPMHMYINTSEDRINKNINGIVDLTKENMIVQSKLYTEMTDFLNKYRVSGYKGGYHENQLNQLLNNMFPTGEVIDTTGQKSSGDFLLKRPNKPEIMFENKDYFENVYNSEITKFIYDSENIKSHGIFLSQQSGIAGKSNYQIDYHKGKVLVYVHNVDYSREKVQLAVDIIDNLSSKLDDFIEDEETVISKEILEEINSEYHEFAIKKDALIGITKEYAKKSIQNLEELKFPSLEKYLSNHFASALKINTKLNNQYTCELCNKYVCSTKKSLSAHQRGCKNQSKK